jgi:hypothetical protein
MTRACDQDHNKLGTKKEVGRCCSCFYNNHGQLYFSGPPDLYCTHEDVRGEPNTKLKWGYRKKVSDFMVEMHDYVRDNNDEVIYDTYGYRLIWFPNMTKEQSKVWHREIKENPEAKIPDMNHHLMEEQLTGFPSWCPLKDE